MENKLHLSASPHIREKRAVPHVMRDVVIALVPALIASFYYFGLRALLITLVAVATALITEHIIAVFMLKRKSPVGDLSAVVTGLLIAFNVPVGIDPSKVIIGTVFAVGVAKWAFGGLGANFINPALAGRAFILASHPAQMTGTIFGKITQGVLGNNVLTVSSSDTTVANQLQLTGEAIDTSFVNISGIPNSAIIDALSSSGTKQAVSDTASVIADTTATNSSAILSKIDAVTSATPLDVANQFYFNIKDTLHSIDPEQVEVVKDTSFDILETFQEALPNLFLGNVGGVLGETSAIAILLGAVYMLYKGVINFTIPFVYIGTVFVLYLISTSFAGDLALISSETLTMATYQILAGGLLLGAFFMATDMVTSPITVKGQAIFAFGCGLLTFIIRRYGGYPEGVSYSILLMNLVVPLIDRYVRPKVYGTKKVKGAKA